MHLFRMLFYGMPSYQMPSYRMPLHQMPSIQTRFLVECSKILDLRGYKVSVKSKVSLIEALQ